MEVDKVLQTMLENKHKNNILSGLGYSRINENMVYAIAIRNHMEFMNHSVLSNKGMRKLLNRHGEERLRKLIEFRRADLLGSGTREAEEVEELIQSYRDKLDEVLKEKPATKFEDLAINGNDIMRICKLKPCEAVGIIKEALMEWVLLYPQLNTYENLERIAWCYYCNDSQEDIKDFIEKNILLGNKY